MALTSPWRFSNYMGQFASDGAADSGIAGYGISVSDGQMYYNTTLYKMRLRANGAWTDMGSAPTDDWMESVLDRLTTPPGSPSTGDRYLIIATATGAWSGKENQIAEWDGSAWAYTIPTLGGTTTVEDENVPYFYNGTSWVKLPTIFDHNDTNNKQGGTGGEYYHLTNAQHSALTGGSDASSIHHHDGRYHIQANSPRLYTNAGNPNGSVTPGKVGDQCFDTTNKILYYATDTTNSGWVWA